MKCPKCNSEIPGSAKFCVQCGNPVADIPAVEEAQPTELKTNPAAAQQPVPQPPVYSQPQRPAQQPNAYPLPPSYPRPQNLPPRQGYPIPPAYPQPPKLTPAPAPKAVPEKPQNTEEKNALPPTYPKPDGQTPSAYPPPVYKPIPQPEAKKNNKVFLWVGIGVAAFVVLLVLGIILLKFLTGTSVGVIGGADGPTTIFVSSTPTPEPTAEPTPTPEPTATPTPTPEPTPTPTPAPYYIISYSSDRYLNENDIAGMDAETLMLARNEIFARHGRKFDTERVREYFEAQSWYNGTIDPDNFNSNVLSDIELYNIEFLHEHQLALQG